MNLGRPQQGEPLKLGMRNLYIVPSRFGLLWLGGMLLLQVVAIQLQSNGPLLLSFLMLGLFLLTLHLTHFNLQGVELRCGDPAPAFAGQPAAYPLEIRIPERCEGLRLRLGNAEPDAPRSLQAGLHRLNVSWTPGQRGRQRPGRLRLFTTAPLGLFLCWSRWDPPRPQLVLPAPQRGPVGRAEAPADPEAAGGGGPSRREGADTWQDLRPHRPEDGAGRLAWKLLARGRGAHAKRFSDPRTESTLLTAAAGVPLEQALEHLCEAILRLHGEGASYGLVLGNRVIPPGRGRSQRDRCLELLALTPAASGEAAQA
jgi:uncharacterized protein (DUF58 family)